MWHADDLLCPMSELRREMFHGKFNSCVLFSSSSLLNAIVGSAATEYARLSRPWPATHSLHNLIDGVAECKEIYQWEVQSVRSEGN